MKSFKVFVVDDDLPILHALRNFSWEQCGCQLAGEARNGEEAFELCRRVEPDIVITDIVMPIMDGIELTKALKQWNPHVQIIIVTSYRDFEYAKEAIHLGVKEYLIKGVYTDEELQLAINRAKEEYDKENISIKYKSESDIIMKNEALINMLDKKDNQDKEDMQLFPSLPARFVMLNLVWNMTPRLLSEKKVSELLHSCKTENIMEIVIISCQEIHILYRDIGGNLIIGEIKKLMAEMESAFDWCVLKCFASIGSIVVNLKDYKSAVKDNQNSLRKKFYYLNSAVFISERISFRLLSKEEKHKLNLSLKALTTSEDIESYLKNDFINYVIENNIDPEDVKLLLFSWISGMLEESAIESVIPFTDEDGHIHCIYDLIDKYLYLYRHIHQSIIPEERYEISKALQIINQKLNTNLTADIIAEEIGLSPNYFGYIFKNNMGQNFKEYLTKVRMEKAMQLIKTTNLKIYEIAEQVGIPNYRYFISVFQKYYSKSPSDIKGGR